MTILKMTMTERPENHSAMSDVMPDIKQENTNMVALVMNKMNEGMMPTHALSLNTFHFKKMHYEQPVPSRAGGVEE